jgi:hypothetical protein
MLVEVSEKNTASMFRVQDHEDGISRLSQNIGKYLPDYTASHPTRP